MAPTLRVRRPSPCNKIKSETGLGLAASCCRSLLLSGGLHRQLPGKVSLGSLKTAVVTISSKIRALGLAGALLFAFGPEHVAADKKDTAPATLRWSEIQPGCTFSRDKDGKYRYALWTDDFGIILAVDSQELQVLPKRVEPFVALHLTVRYRGNNSLIVDPRRATLEFVKHFKLVQPALNPEEFARQTQDDADAVEHETQREIKKHPDRREAREKYVEAFQKETEEFLEFLSARTLPYVQLDKDHAEITGWVLFSAKNKWLGTWERPEEFVLRMPLAGRIVEMPFSLPPQQGDLILRQR